MGSWRAACISVVLFMAYPTGVMAQGTLVVAATPATLGSIPDAQGPICEQPGWRSRAITFAVPSASVTVTSVQLGLTATHTRVGNLLVKLAAPDGTFHILVTRPGARADSDQGNSADLAGLYEFGDGFAGILDTVTSAVVPPGQYAPFGAMNATFAGRLASGIWTLTVTDQCADDTGSVSAATLTLTGTPAVSVTATPSTLGAIPDGPPDSNQTPGPPRDVTFVVPPGRGPVKSVRVSATLSHSWVGDLVAELMSPTGARHVLFGYTGATSAASNGSSADLGGDYEFDDHGAGGLWWPTAAVFPTGTMPSGSYFSSQRGGPVSTGATTFMDPVFMGTPSAGQWTLRLTDGHHFDVGTISAASLALETFATPSSYADSYSTLASTSLSVAAPGVLANDTDNLGGAMTAQLVSGPSHGVLSLAQTGAFTYTPAFGYAGPDSFMYRAANSSGPGNITTVSLTVTAPSTVQPPTAFEVSSVAGNDVTLRWTPSPLGPPATDFVVEGGVAPGQVLGAMAVGGPLPLLTFAAPTGAFYVRVHAIANGLRSGPSNEIPLFVNTVTPPSAPATLLGSVNGGALALSWRNTFAGGAPSSNVVDITGSVTATVPVPLGETFAFNGVPGGTYTFRTRAANGAGTSGASNGVTLTFPQGCSGAPAPPERVLAYAVGRVITLVWDPPSSGPAATAYQLTVGGAFAGTFPLGSARVLRAPAPPGAYTLSVVATNACGASAASAVPTVFVQ